MIGVADRDVVGIEGAVPEHEDAGRSDGGAREALAQIVERERQLDLDVGVLALRALHAVDESREGRLGDVADAGELGQRHPGPGSIREQEARRPGGGEEALRHRQVVGLVALRPVVRRVDDEQDEIVGGQDDGRQDEGDVELHRRTADRDGRGHEGGHREIRGVEPIVEGEVEGGGDGGRRVAAHVPDPGPTRDRVARPGAAGQAVEAADEIGAGHDLYGEDGADHRRPVVVIAAAAAGPERAEHVVATGALPAGRGRVVLGRREHAVVADLEAPLGPLVEPELPAPLRPSARRVVLEPDDLDDEDAVRRGAEDAVAAGLIAVLHHQVVPPDRDEVVRRAGAADRRVERRAARAPEGDGAVGGDGHLGEGATEVAVLERQGEGGVAVVGRGEAERGEVADAREYRQRHVERGALGLQDGLRGGAAGAETDGGEAREDGEGARGRSGGATRPPTGFRPAAVLAPFHGGG